MIKKNFLFFILCFVGGIVCSQSDLRRLVPFEIPIGLSESEAKFIISKHQISINGSEYENGRKKIKYVDDWDDNHVLWLTTRNGKVLSVDWGWVYPHDANGAYKMYNAIKVYLEETYGMTAYVIDNSKGRVDNIQCYFTNFKNSEYGACLVYYAMDVSSAQVFAYLLGAPGYFSQYDKPVVEIVFHPSSYIQELINKDKQKKIEEERKRQEQQKREEEERQRELENKAMSYVQQGVLYKKQELFEEAIGQFEEAFNLLPDWRTKYGDEYKACKQGERRVKESESLQDAGAEFLAIYKYEDAREKYNKALPLVKRYEENIRKQLRKIDEIESLDKERQNTVYDYSELEKNSYNSATQKAKEKIEDYFKKYPLQACTVTFIQEIPIEGTWKYDVKITPDNPDLRQYLKGYFPKMQESKKYGLRLHTKAEITINVTDVDIKVFSAKNGAKGVTANHELKRTLPQYGKYQIEYKHANIGGKVFRQEKILSYKNTGGPANAWLSVLVPGLGQHKVTYGRRSGVGTTILVYSLAGSGIGLWAHSNKCYDKYHLATTQSDMDKYFKSAKQSRDWAYTVFAAAASLWVADIISVAVQGKKNVQKYGKNEAYVTYMPQYEAVGFGYTLNF